MVLQAFETLRQHELVILRRLRNGPLTEFELAREVAESSTWSAEEAFARIGDWLEALRREGLVWSGKLFDQRDQFIVAAALTNKGRALVQ